LVLRPNVDLDRARSLLIQFGSELRNLLLSSFEARMERLDQCVAVVLVRDRFGPGLGLRRDLLYRFYRLRGRRGLRLRREREFRHGRHFLHGFDSDGLRHGRRDLCGLGDRRP
jgi:hypothetical protein